MSFPSISSYWFPRTARGNDTDGQRLISIEAVARGGRLRYRTAAPGTTASSAIVAAGILQRESFTRWLTAPRLSPRKAGKVVSTLLDIQLPFPIDTCEHAVVTLAPSPDRQGTAALVVGARHSDIRARLHSLSAIGVDPHILDQEGVALWSQWNEEYAQGAPDGTVAVLYFASDRVTISLGQNGRFLAAHTWRNPDVEAMLRTLKPYIGNERNAFPWFLAGPAAAQERTGAILRILSSSLGLPPAQTVHEPESFLARALARRALNGLSRRCNLRSGPFEHGTERQRRRRQSLLSAAACLAAGLALCGLNLAWRTAAFHRTAALQQDLHALAVSVTGNPRLVPPRQELFAARRSLQDRQQRSRPFMAPFVTGLAVPLQAVLDTAARNDLTVESIILHRQALVAHGCTRDFSGCDKSAASLTKAGWTTRIERKENRQGENLSAYVLRLTLPDENF